MISRLMARAESIAQAAQRRRLEEIAAEICDRGFTVKAESNSVIFRGSQLVQNWLSDPVLRFIGKIGS